MTKKFIEAGFYFTLGGVITFTHDYDEMVNLLPIDRILLETDAPYVAPTPYRGKRNEPSYVQEVVKRIAEIRADDPESVRGTLVQNALNMIR